MSASGSSSTSPSDPDLAPEALAPNERLPIAVGDLAVGKAPHGKYRIDKILGMGKTAVVAAATRADDRGVRVALKVMRKSRAAGGAGAGDKNVELFLAEARAAIPLKNDHVAKVHDVGVLDPSGLPFVAMELLEGGGHDLATVLERQGVVRASIAIDYILQACDAVSEAHRLGIIHRDLRPKNLFLTHANDGAPLIKVLDFGTSRITHASTAKRSPMYMAPEQVRGSAGDADERTDIWALGAILFELVTGHRPFDADNVAEIVSKIVDRPTPALEIFLPNAPPGLNGVIHRCLEKDRKKRYATAGALAMALSDLGARPSIAPVPSWNRSIDLNVDSLAAGAAGAPTDEPPPSLGPASSKRIPRGKVLSSTFVLPGRKTSLFAPLLLVAAIASVGILIGGALYARHRQQIAEQREHATTTPTSRPTPTSLPPPPQPSASSVAAEPPSSSSATTEPASSRPRHRRRKP